MRLATCHMPWESEAARAGGPEAPGVPWVRFGDDVLLYAPDETEETGTGAQRSQVGFPRRSRLCSEEGVPPSQGRGERGLAAARLLPGTVAKERLHLVIQEGDLFEREHPEVPVLLNRGHYLVVDLDPGRAPPINAAGRPRYRVKPLPENQTVYAVRRPPPERAARMAWIEERVTALSLAEFEADLRHLVQFHTRFSTQPEYREAAAWARARLGEMGYAAELREIAVGSRTSQNVVAEKTGSGAGTRQIVLVGAHLDSINQAGGPAARAPGADDNGSGSAGVLAIARALKEHSGVHDLRLVLFGGEEQGLHGSRQYVASLTAAERARISAVVTMDMIATLNTASPAVLLEGAPGSQRVIDGLADAAATYAELVVQTSLEPHDSDHVSFLDAGLPAVLTIEGADESNHNVHSDRDTMDPIHFELAHQILRMNVAFVAQAVGRSGSG